MGFDPVLQQLPKAVISNILRCIILCTKVGEGYIIFYATPNAIVITLLTTYTKFLSSLTSIITDAISSRMENEVSGQEHEYCTCYIVL